MENENRRLNSQLRDTEQEKQALRQQSVKLREIVIKTDNETVDDHSVIVSFVSFRTEIQRIVGKFHCLQPQEKPILPQKSFPMQQIFAQAWETMLIAAQLQNRARSMIFQILHLEILSIPCFGLENIWPTAILENELVNLEIDLNELGSKDPRNLTRLQLIFFTRQKGRGHGMEKAKDEVCHLARRKSFKADTCCKCYPERHGAFSSAKTG